MGRNGTLLVSRQEALQLSRAAEAQPVAPDLDKPKEGSFGVPQGTVGQRNLEDRGRGIRVKSERWTRNEETEAKGAVAQYGRCPRWTRPFLHRQATSSPQTPSPGARGPILSPPPWQVDPPTLERAGRLRSLEAPAVPPRRGGGDAWPGGSGRWHAGDQAHTTRTPAGDARGARWESPGFENKPLCVSRGNGVGSRAGPASVATWDGYRGHEDPRPLVTWALGRVPA